MFAGGSGRDYISYQLTMKTLIKLGAILGGYVLAFLLAWVVLGVYVAATDSPERQASAGMASFGDTFVLLGVFGLAALAPTAAALWALRTCRWVWVVLASVAVGVALTGLASLVAYVGWRTDTAPGVLPALAMFAPMRMLFAPLCMLLMAPAAVCAPSQSPRIALAVATLVEIVAFAGFVFVLFRSIP